ncbi:MAG: PilZ domain-containing protein [Bryobacterales bacterium]|nr:PilZ domain-containing protein [Bryobacterales bacterium]
MLKKTRRHDREPFQERVTLTWAGSDGNGRIMQGTGVTISRSGFSIKVPEQLQLQSYVSFRTRDGRLSGSGSVRHCVRSGVEYLVGIEFSGGLEWRSGTK